MRRFRLASDRKPRPVDGVPSDMDIVLVPGFWLDASSWDAVTPPLVEAGHRVHPLTLPGLESRDAPRAGIGLRDHIDFVAAQVDALDGDVVLVGHSGGGAVIHGVADLRPDRIARNVYVDSGPPAQGEPINDELPAEGDEIPLPPWDVFMEMDLVDLDDAAPGRLRGARDPAAEGRRDRRDPPVGRAPPRRARHDHLLRVPLAGAARRDGGRRAVGRRGGPAPRRGVRRPAHRALAAVQQAGRARRGDRRGAAGR